MRKVALPILKAPFHSWGLPCLAVSSLHGLWGQPPSLTRPAGAALGPAPHFLDVTTHYTEPLSTKLGLWQLYYKFITC